MKIRDKHKGKMLMIYVAFLRGINIGGHRKISMMYLKETFESLGFENVVTYGNSGNVVFSYASKDQEKIAQKIEGRIQKDFPFEIKVLVRGAQNILKTCKEIPVSWEIGKGMMTNVIFLWEEIDNPDILKEIHMDPKMDKVKYVSGAVLWNVSMGNLSKSAVYKFISTTKISKQVTLRSVNPVRKLNQIISRLSSEDKK